MTLENLRISTRLYTLAGVATLALCALLTLSWVGLNQLAELQNEGARRATDSEEIQASSRVGEALYRVIADSVINRDFDSSSKAWTTAKEQALKDIVRADELADTEEEHAFVANASKALTELFDLYENQLLPSLNTDQPETDATAAIRELDASMDSKISALRDSLTPLALALQAEARAANESFDAARERIAAGNLVIAGTMLLILIWLATLIIASILRQLGGEPAQVVEIAHKIAGGDLSTAIEVDKKHSGSVLAAVKEMQAHLASLILGINQSITGVQSSADKLSTISQQASTGSGQQSAATTSIAAAMQQLTASIEQVSSNAEDAERIAAQSGELSSLGEKNVDAAVEEMHKIAEAVKETATQMAHLHEQALKIGSVMTVIGEVAEQTNLLALNAAIEAARAGESGRGFAVVADEVRKLAERTANSAKEISGMVENIQSHSEQASASMNKGSERVVGGVELANLAGDSMQNISHGSDDVVNAISEISAALSEQKIASTNISRNLEVIAQMTEGNAIIVTAVASTATTLKALSDQLRQSVAGFKTTSPK